MRVNRPLRAFERDTFVHTLVQTLSPLLLNGVVKSGANIRLNAERTAERGAERGADCVARIEFDEFRPDGAVLWLCEGVDCAARTTSDIAVGRVRL